MSAGNERHAAGTDRFLVGDWTVTPSRNVLSRDGEEVRLEPRVMDTLVHFARHPDAIVSKDELVADVWQARHVSDEVLTVTIYALRKALGDDARRPRYIETVSRRGYRLIAPVKPAPAGAGPESTAVPPQAAAPETRRGRSALMMVAALTFAAVATGAVWRITPARHRRHVQSAEAHEAYVRGRAFLDLRSIQGWRQAQQQFERAVAIDPDDPAALAGLADTYSAMSDFGVASPAEMRPRAMKSAARALELDPLSAEAHEALGRARFLFDWDFAGAARSLGRAVELDPDYMPAWQSTAWLASARAQYAEAEAAARQALQLDPVNTARYTELAWVLALAGRHDQALHEIERALQLNPRSFETRLMKGWALELAGKPAAAFATYREAHRLNGVPDHVLERIDAVYRTEGLAGYYRGWLKTPGGDAPMSETWRAQVYVRAGDLDRAIDSLEHAYEKHEGALAWVNVEPTFVPLRSDARFQSIAARIGHAQ